MVWNVEMVEVEEKNIRSEKQKLEENIQECCDWSSTSNPLFYNINSEF